MADSARAIIHYPYESRGTGKKYNSILLVQDRLDRQKRFALPGGQFDGKKDKTWEDALKREVWEELGLRVTGERFVGSIPAALGGKHHLYVAEAKGNLELDYYLKQKGKDREVAALGFYGAGRHNMLPDNAQQGHLLALRGLYKWDPEWDPDKKTPEIAIPGRYFDRWRNIMEGVRRGEGVVPKDGNGGWRV